MFTLLLVANGTFLVAAAIEERESDELGCLREDMGEFFSSFRVSGGRSL
jgi:hypothetical protein